MRRLIYPLEERLRYHTLKTGFGPDDCWLWTGSKDKRGYGHIRAGRKILQAHRAVWEVTYGPIPAGLDVCHRCDNPPCIRPDHLFLGSEQDNAIDKTQKGRSTKGERNPSAKLTQVEVDEIRRLAQDNPQITHGHAASEGMKALGERFGVHPQTIWNVLHNRYWIE